MSRQAGSRGLVAGAVALLVGAAPAFAEPLRIRGTRVSLEPPPGFVQAEKFPGLQNPEHPLASIVIAEMPAPVGSLFAACELVAEATDPKSGTPITVYLGMIAEPGKGYYLTTGMVGRARAAEWLPEFRAATASFTRARS